MKLDLSASPTERQLSLTFLRATSTMITALQAGASGIYPVETVLEARTLQREGDLLAGERFCRKIPGFDLGNSPEDFTPEAVKDRRIVLTTTNGTRADSQGFAR